MAARRGRFACGECGYESPRWMGRCPECRSWGTLSEAASPAGPAVAGSALEPVRLDQPAPSSPRLPVGMPEADRVLGGGLVPGATVLLGGEPGVGKSTLLLQAAARLSAEGPVLYVSGEESVEQLRLQADRLGSLSGNLQVAAETNLEAVGRFAEHHRPRLLVVDSVQTARPPDAAGAWGSPQQLREAALCLAALAKRTGVPAILVGHVTKASLLAGPKALEHLVDVVLSLEGEEHRAYRILRCVKNRFGPLSEIGVFTTTPAGLKEVPNPSELFLSDRAAGVPGSAVACSLEDSRPLLVEVQALVAPGTPRAVRRAAGGLEQYRLSLLLAVLEKRLGVNLQAYDVYVKVAGGARLTEPAADLAVALAVASAHRDRPVPAQLVAFGEVGLGGEVRTVARAQARVDEAARLGFTTCIVPVGNTPGLGPPGGIPVRGAADLRSALTAVLGGRRGAPA